MTSQEQEEIKDKDIIKILSPLEALDIYKLTMTETNDYNKIELISKIIASKNLNKLTKFLKTHNTPEYLNLILYLIPYPDLIQWYYELNILRYYWNESIINKLVYNNLLNLKINYINKTDYKQHMILLNNQYNCYYNFIDKVINKRLNIILSYITSLLTQNTKKINLTNISFGSDFVKLLGSKNYQDILTKTLTITLYLTDNIVFNDLTNYCSKFPYYYLTINNITFKIFQYQQDDDKVICNNLDQAIFNLDTKEIYCNAVFYQSLETGYISEFITPDKVTQINALTMAIKSSDKYALSVVNLIPCYICKQYITNIVQIDTYNNLCLDCAKINYINKNLKTDLSGKTFLITGGRVKIGFTTAVKLLRMNAQVIITTRYPHFAMTNYQQESDYNIWKDKLTIIQCDFTKLPEIYSMLDMLSNYTFNGIINNACQTIKNTQTYYDNLQEIETELQESMTHNTLGFLSSAIVPYHNTKLPKILSNTVYTDIVIKTTTPMEMSAFKDIKDKPHISSWDQKIDEIKPEEIVEATLINQLVPTLIINKLKNKLIGPKFIINVTSLEGTFNHGKTDKHIHTNMCKAAMNMMIRSLAEDPDKDLHVYAVNPGYVSGVCPQKDKYALSLDDGASRILYPIIKVIQGEPLPRDCILMVNYKKTDW